MGFFFVNNDQHGGGGKVINIARYLYYQTKCTFFCTGSNI